MRTDLDVQFERAVEVSLPIDSAFGARDVTLPNTLPRTAPAPSQPGQGAVGFSTRWPVQAAQVSVSLPRNTLVQPSAASYKDNGTFRRSVRPGDSSGREALGALPPEELSDGPSRGPQVACNTPNMNFHLSLIPLIPLIAGVLILIIPKLLNFIVAVYLILVGLIGIFGQGSLHIR